MIEQCGQRARDPRLVGRWTPVGDVNLVQNDILHTEHRRRQLILSQPRSSGPTSQLKHQISHRWALLSYIGKHITVQKLIYDKNRKDKRKSFNMNSLILRTSGVVKVREQVNNEFSNNLRVVWPLIQNYSFQTSIKNEFHNLYAFLSLLKEFLLNNNIHFDNIISIEQHLLQCEKISRLKEQQTHLKQHASYLQFQQMLQSQKDEQHHHQHLNYSLRPKFWKTQNLLQTIFFRKVI